MQLNCLWSEWAKQVHDEPAVSPRGTLVQWFGLTIFAQLVGVEGGGLFFTERQWQQRHVDLVYMIPWGHLNPTGAPKNFNLVEI